VERISWSRGMSRATRLLPSTATWPKLCLGEALNAGDVVCLHPDTDRVIRSASPMMPSCWGWFSTSPGMVRRREWRQREAAFPRRSGRRVPAGDRTRMGPSGAETCLDLIHVRPRDAGGDNRGERRAMARAGTILGKALGSLSGARAGGGLRDAPLTDFGLAGAQEVDRREVWDDKRESKEAR